MTNQEHTERDYSIVSGNTNFFSFMAAENILIFLLSALT